MVECALVLVDVQERLLGALFDAEPAIQRCRFLLEVAHLLEVPILATEQSPSKMGPTVPILREIIAEPSAKDTFSAWGCPAFQDRLTALAPREVVLIGVETHICITLTAQDLTAGGHRVIVARDGVTARSESRHIAGLDGLAASGVQVEHTETVAYRWMKRADEPRFRAFLEIVKRFS